MDVYYIVIIVVVY